MQLENNSLKMTHLTKGYYLREDGVLFSRHGTDSEGLRSVKWTKKLRERLSPFLSKHILTNRT